MTETKVHAYGTGTTRRDTLLEAPGGAGPLGVNPTGSDFASIDEDSRLAAVRRFAVLDTPPDGTFDAITALAAKLFDVPVAIVSIVDSDRIWFKSHHGLDVDQIERGPGLCSSAILSDDAYVLPDAVLDPVAMTNPLVAGAFGMRFYAAAPLVTGDGHRLGTLCVIDHQPRSPSARDIEVLSDLAAIVVRELELRLEARTVVSSEAQFREAAESSRRESDDLAHALQTALLPPRLPAIPGVELAARYLPVGRSAQVGGDFYDVFPLPRRAWGIVMGDVCGKGPRAASVTAAARYCLRGAALEHPRPADVLHSVNETLLLGTGEDNAEEPPFCTLVYARLRPHGDAFHLTVASGGHPRPQVLRANGSTEPLGGTGSLVGVLPDATFTESGSRLRVGDTVVFFTDGITEAKLGDGMLEREGLVDQLRASVGLSAGPIIERLTKLALSEGIQRDDIAVLALRITGHALLDREPDTSTANSA